MGSKDLFYDNLHHFKDILKTFREKFYCFNFREFINFSNFLIYYFPFEVFHFRRCFIAYVSWRFVFARSYY